MCCQWSSEIKGTDRYGLSNCSMRTDYILLISVISWFPSLLIYMVQYSFLQWYIHFFLDSWSYITNLSRMWYKNLVALLCLWKVRQEAISCQKATKLTLFPIQEQLKSVYWYNQANLSFASCTFEIQIIRISHKIGLLQVIVTNLVDLWWNLKRKTKTKMQIYKY